MNTSLLLLLLSAAIAQAIPNAPISDDDFPPTLGQAPQGVDEAPSLNGKPPPADLAESGEKDAAVVVGVEDYVFVSDIAGADESATEWYQWFRESRGVAQDRINLIRNHEATRENLEDAVARAVRDVEPGGTLWFVFIGHGAPGEAGREGVLVGADAQQTARSLYARSLSQSGLQQSLALGAQARTILVLDTCFSGKDSGGKALIDNLQPLVPIKEEPPSRVLTFTAAQSDEFAGPLPQKGRPAFSYLMLGALRGWADRDGDDKVTAKEAVEYTQHALKVLVSDRNQTPQLSTTDPTAVLAAGKLEKGPNLDELKLTARDWAYKSEEWGWTKARRDKPSMKWPTARP